MNAVIVEMAALFLLLLLNGLFSMSELAIVSARPTRLQNRAKAGSRRAKAALELLASPDKFLSTVQIGITLVGVLTGVFSGATLAEELKQYFKTIDFLAPYSSGLSLGLVVLPVTYLTLVIGELGPKRLALAWPEKLAEATAPFMRLLMRLSYPAVKLLSLSTDALIWLLKLKANPEHGITEEDIEGIIGEGARHGVLERAEKEMFERLLWLGDRQAGEVMTHRSKVVWLELDDPWPVNREKMKHSPYSRYPVARGDLAELAGVVQAKEILLASQGRDDFELKPYLREPLYVPEAIKILRVLDLFKRNPEMDFAAITDEYGYVLGILTLNDILQAIVGEITNEPENCSLKAAQRADGSWLLDASLPMDQVYSILNLPRRKEDSGAYQTLAGFVLSNFGGELPKLGSYVERLGYRFEIVDLDGRTIDSVLAKPLNPS